MTVRVLVVGDDHEARRLRDEGIEVIYLDDAEAAHVARIAVQEDVETVVTSRTAEVIAALARDDAQDIDVRSPQG